METKKIGVVGCGNISPIYLKNITTLYRNIEVRGVCDLIPERAQKAAADWKIQTIYEKDEDLFADPEVDIVLNITRPVQHAEVTRRALLAGKHVHAEKPMAICRRDALPLMELAEQKGLRLGNAPDTFLGAGLQTCRKLLDDGYIGRPVAATAFMMGRGPEGWHPDAEFFYQTGGGPVFDMAPYYITALVSLLGPVARLTGSAKKSFATRTMATEEKFGKVVEVEIPTHVSGILEFANGVTATTVFSFDVWKQNLPFIEIYGTEGTLSVPDPNTFGGPVRLYRPGQGQEFFEVPLTHPYAENSRGLALADMASAIAHNRPHRASAQLAFHVLDIMEGMHDSALSGLHYTPVSTCERPAPLPTALLKGTVD